MYGNSVYGGASCLAEVMMAHEARFINEQARLGYLQLTKKPTTNSRRLLRELKISERVLLLDEAGFVGHHDYGTENGTAAGFACIDIVKVNTLIRHNATL